MSTQKELADAQSYRAGFEDGARCFSESANPDKYVDEYLARYKSASASLQPETKPVADWIGNAADDIADLSGESLGSPESIADIIHKHAPQPSQEVTVDEIRQWLLRQTASTPEGYVRSWHFALLDMEKAINAIKAERADKSQAAKENKP